jgi:outer membrane protein OmpA-like peptidoglycan-associated protein
MFFETSNKTPAGGPGSKPIQQAPPARTQATNLSSRNPPKTNMRAAEKPLVAPATLATQPGRPPLTTKSTVSQRPVSPPLPTAVKTGLPQRGIPTSSARKLQKKQIVGFPSRQLVSKKPSASTIQIRKGHVRPVTPQIQQRTMQRPGQKPPARRQYYYPGTRSYGTYNKRGIQAQPINANLPAAVPQVQSTVIGWPSRQGYNAPSVSQPCDCSKCRSQAIIQATPQVIAQVPAAPPIAVTQKATCSTCGLRTKGCITLSGFALNSALLEPRHKQQLQQLAATILQRNINGVIATGYTNSYKAEQMVESLGEKRALTAITELKRQLSKLKPQAHKNIFWKTISQTVAQPNVAGPSGNRRVVICIRQLK